MIKKFAQVNGKGFVITVPAKVDTTTLDRPADFIDSMGEEGVQRPGWFETEEAAKRAMDLTDEGLIKLQEKANKSFNTRQKQNRTTPDCRNWITLKMVEKAL